MGLNCEIIQWQNIKCFKKQVHPDCLKINEITEKQKETYVV